jgi:hypothetical protein
MTKDKDINPFEADEELAQRSRALLAATDPGLQAPPFLKTRVLAHWREKEARARNLRWWQRVAATSLALSLSLVLWVTLRSGSSVQSFQATANQPVAVKVEMHELKMAEVAQVEIELPEGVQFFSLKYPDLQSHRKLSLAWNPTLDSASLPFVIQSSLVGKRAVKVRFLNGKNELVTERTLEIEFVEPKVKS